MGQAVPRTLSCPVLRRGEEWACHVNSGHNPITGPGSVPRRSSRPCSRCRVFAQAKGSSVPSLRPGAVLAALTSLLDTSPASYRPLAGSLKAGSRVLTPVQGPRAGPMHSRCSVREVEALALCGF